VTRTARALAAALGLAPALACAPAGDTPEQVVALWFRALGRAPVRAYLLLDERYHHTHGLRMFPGGEAPDPDEPEPLRLARARVGWLRALEPAVVRERARELAVAIEDTWREDGRAVVRTRVRAPGGADFAQVFDLVRDDGGWRIAGIEQRGLEPASWGAAYAAAPTREGYRRVRRLERWRETASP